MLKPLSLSALATAPKADAAPVLREAGLGAWLHPVFPAPAFAPLAWEPSSSPAVVPLLLELLSPITFQEDAGAELVGLVCEALSHWAASVDPLPLPLREDYVRDAAEALKSPLVQARPLHERVRFLFQVPVTLPELRRGCRVLREDQMYNAEQFFASPDVASKSWHTKLAFLKEKGLTNDELAEVQDVYGGAGALTGSNRGSPPAPAAALPPKSPLPGGEQVTRASKFLLSDAAKAVPKPELLAFLQKQGLDAMQVHQAATLAGDQALALLAVPAGGGTAPAATAASTAPAATASPTLDQAVAFLSSPAARAASEEERTKFLAKKGLSSEQILQAKQRAAAAGSPPDELAKALTFLRNPALASRSVEERVAFLKSRGVSDGVVEQALKQLQPSPVSGASDSTAADQPWLELAVWREMCRVLRLPGCDGLARVCLAAVLAQTCRGVAGPDAFQELCVGSVDWAVDSPALEAMAAAAVGLCDPRVLQWVAGGLEGGEEELCTARLDRGLMLARVVHRHLCPRLAARSFSLCGRMHAAAQEHAFARAGMFRGGPEYGWGLARARRPLAFDFRALLRAQAQASPRDPGVGLALVYAGPGVGRDGDTLPALLSGLLDGCLCVDESLRGKDLETCVASAAKFVARAPFRLVPSCAQAVVDAALAAAKSEPKPAEAGGRAANGPRAAVFERAHAHAQRVFLHWSGSAPARVVARRLVQKAYDPEQAARPLEQVLGVHADLGRVLNTNFMCLVVVLEPLLQPEAPVQAFLAWDALAFLGAGLVPAQDALRFQRWIETVAGFDPDAVWRTLVAQLRVQKPPALQQGELQQGELQQGELQQGELQQGERAVEEEEEEEDARSRDYLLGARAEYLLDTGARFLWKGWLAAAVRREDDDAGEAFVGVLELGAAHRFASLNKRAHLWMQDAVERCRGTDAGEAGDGEPLALRRAGAFLGVSVGACGKGAAELGTSAFCVASVMTSLATTGNPCAALVAARGFAAMTQRVTRAKASRDLFTLLCTSLKVVPLGVLPFALKRMAQVFRTARFLQGLKDDVGPMGLDVGVMEDVMRGVVNRTDDSSRRAVLGAWFAKLLRAGGGTGVARL